MNHFFSNKFALTFYLPGLRGGVSSQSLRQSVNLEFRTWNLDWLDFYSACQ